MPVPKRLCSGRRYVNYRGFVWKKVMQKNNLLLYRIDDKNYTEFMVVHPNGTIEEFMGKPADDLAKDAITYMAMNTDFIKQNSGSLYKRKMSLVVLTYAEITFLLDIIPDLERWRFLIKKLRKAKGDRDAEFMAGSDVG